jgi:hypothetical protein
MATLAIEPIHIALEPILVEFGERQADKRALLKPTLKSIGGLERVYDRYAGRWSGIRLKSPDDQIVRTPTYENRDSIFGTISQS